MPTTANYLKVYWPAVSLRNVSRLNCILSAQSLEVNQWQTN